jgi:hypothetical protein
VKRGKKVSDGGGTKGAGTDILFVEDDGCSRTKEGDGRRRRGGREEKEGSGEISFGSSSLPCKDSAREEREEDGPVAVLGMEALDIVAAENEERRKRWEEWG